MIHSSLLYLHIVSGSIALLSGVFPLYFKKGSRQHILSGKIFYFSMLVAAISALILSLVGASYFLLAISIFTLSFLLSGRRYLYIIDRTGTANAGLLEWSITVGTLVSAVIFSYISFLQISNGNSGGIIALVFGGIGFLFCIQDFRIFTGRLKSSIIRYRIHLSRMMAAYIASTTAFIVAGLDIVSIWAWLSPTIVGTTLIFFFIRKLKNGSLLASTQ